MAVADPELLVLFEDWLDELEHEVIAFLAQHRPGESRGPWRIISGCRSEGRTFLISKLQREGKLS